MDPDWCSREPRKHQETRKPKADEDASHAAMLLQVDSTIKGIIEVLHHHVHGHGISQEKAV